MQIIEPAIGSDLNYPIKSLRVMLHKSSAVQISYTMFEQENPVMLTRSWLSWTILSTSEHRTCAQKAPLKEKCVIPVPLAEPIRRQQIVFKHHCLAKQPQFLRPSCEIILQMGHLWSLNIKQVPKG